MPSLSWSEVRIDQAMSLEQFKAEVQRCLLKIPEIQAPVWHWSRLNPTSRISIDGSLVIGCMHWVYKKIQNQPVAEISRIPISTIAEIAISTNSDVDVVYDSRVFMNPNDSDLAPTDIEIDLQTSDVYKKFLFSTGGATCSKVRVGSNFTEDLLGGFVDFYNQRLVYFLPKTDPARDPDTLFSPLNRLIHFGRLIALLPELTVRENEYRKMRTVVASEQLRTSAYSEDEIKSIRYALLKLFAAFGDESLITAFSFLKKINVFPLLHKKGFFPIQTVYAQCSYEKRSEKFHDLFFSHAFERAGFSVLDKLAILHIVNPFDLSVWEQALQQLISESKNFDEFDAVLKMYKDTKGYFMTTVPYGKLYTNFRTWIKLKSLDPTPEQLAQAKAHVCAFALRPFHNEFPDSP